VSAAVARNVLFLCTGNSARSILAEAAINHPAIGRGAFRGFSAGSHPKGAVHPLALETLRDRGIAVAGLRSKSWEEFGRDGAPRMDVVITVCDQAAAEPCPLWPGHPIAAHWSLPDPAAVTGSDDDRRRAFEATYEDLRRRIEGLVATGG
jgi:arsenate reductase